MKVYPDKQEFIERSPFFGSEPVVLEKDGSHFLAIEPLFMKGFGSWILEAMICNQARTHISLQLEKEDLVWLKNRIDELLEEARVAE